MRTRVILTKFATKQLQKIPQHIQTALDYWILVVEDRGIHESRKISGYHDEPLKGARAGQRSVRLNRSYRVIYIETVELIEITVIEVNKHDY